MAGERNKKTVLDLVKHSRAAFESVLSRYDDNKVVNLFSPDGWNLKDVMAHITFWESYVVDRFEEASQGKTPRTYGTLPLEELNRINQAALDAGRKQTLQEVRDNFERVHDKLLAAVEAMPEAMDHPWWAVWPDHDLPWQLIQYNTWDHYNEHLHNMEAWL